MSGWQCIRNYFGKHRVLLGLSIGVIVATVIVSLIPPQILRYIVDGILDGGRKQELLTFALLYTGMYLLVGLVSLAKEGLMVCISQGISKELRISMLKHVNRLTYLNFTRYDSASLEAYFNNDVAAINTLITSGVVSIGIDLFKMIGIVISIFIFSVQFGMLVLVILPFLAWFAMFVRKRMFRAQINTRNLEGKVNHLVYENVENIEAVKLYDTNSYSSQKYENVLERHFTAAQTSTFYDAVFSPIMETVKDIIIVAVILLSGYRADMLGMSVGVVVSTISLLTDLFHPVQNLGMELQTIQKSMAGITRINQFFALTEEEEKTSQGNLDKEHLILRFEDVSFSYDGKEEVISHFNFCMEGTDKITLQGRSGAGKSTLFKLAYGLLKPTSGKVTINGLDTILLPDEMKAGLFGMVYQEPFFSGETIYEELSLHRNIPEYKVREALDMVGLSRITDLQQTFSKNDFSTGELSLLNIARVILTDCKVLFLDEMNARIDPATAGMIMDTMNRIAQDKMVLSINHYGSLLDHSKVLQLEG